MRGKINCDVFSIKTIEWFSKALLESSYVDLIFFHSSFDFLYFQQDFQTLKKISSFENIHFIGIFE